MASSLFTAEESFFLFALWRAANAQTDWLPVLIPALYLTQAEIDLLTSPRERKQTNLSILPLLFPLHVLRLFTQTTPSFYWWNRVDRGRGRERWRNRWSLLSSWQPTVSPYKATEWYHMVGNAWALEGGTRCTEWEAAAAGERRSDKEGGVVLSSLSGMEGGEIEWQTQEDRERERGGRGGWGGGGGGVGRRANCLLGATTGTGEGGLWRILGARERHIHTNTLAHTEKPQWRKNGEGGGGRGRRVEREDAPSLSRNGNSLFFLCVAAMTVWR